MKLGEKTVRKSEGAGDDPDLDREIATVTANLTRTQRDAFAKKTYELRDATRKLKEGEAAIAEKAALEVRIKELEAKSTIVQPGEDLKKQLDEYEKELSSVRLERTAAYRREIAEPLAEQHAAVVALAKAADISEEDVAAAFAKTGVDRDRRLGEILTNLSEMNKVRFVQAVNNIDSLLAKRDSLLANAQQSLVAMQQREVQTTAEQAAARKAELAAFKPVAWEKIAGQVPDLVPVEGNQLWNDALVVAQNFAERDFTEFAVSAQAEIMQRAGAFPLLAGTISHLREQVQLLTQDLKAYRTGTPAVAAGSRPSEAASGTAPTSFNEAVGRRLAAAGVH